LRKDTNVVDYYSSLLLFLVLLLLKTLVLAVFWTRGDRKLHSKGTEAPAEACKIFGQGVVVMRPLGSSHTYAWPGANDLWDRSEAE